MAVGVAEGTEAKGLQSANQPARGQRETAASQAAPQARFFLGKSGPNGGAPALEREYPTEAEALSEAFKAGVNYYAVVEYRALVDCSGKQPLFKKEVVKRNP